MKKVLLTILTALVLIGIQPLSSANAAAKNENYSIFIDGKRVLTSSRAFVEKGTTLIPLEPVAKALEMKYIYNKKTKTATITKDKASASFVMGNKAVTINGNKQGVIIAPKEKGGVVYVPLTIVGQVAKLPINVDSDTKVVQIGKKVQLDQFFHMNWGMNKEQVKKLETRVKEVDRQNDELGQYQLTYQEYFGDNKFPARINYLFEDNKLVEAVVMYTSSSFDNSYSTYTDSYDHLNRIYGEPSGILMWGVDPNKIEAYWKTYEDDFEKMIYMAIRSKELMLSSKYQNNNTDVTLVMMNSKTPEIPKITTFIEYKPFNKGK